MRFVKIHRDGKLDSRNIFMDGKCTGWCDDEAYDNNNDMNDVCDHIQLNLSFYSHTHTDV